MSRPKRKPWIGWHFLPADGMTRYLSPTKVYVGRVLRETRPLVMCECGLHACRSALDALGYAPGPIACLVELRGPRIDGPDKSCAAERKCLAKLDATNILHEFACWCAEQALKAERKAGREPDQRSWEAVRVKRRWLKGKAADEERADAGYTAWAAARYEAWDASRAASRYDAARDDAARYAARDASRAAQNKKLESMLRKAMKK